MKRLLLSMGAVLFFLASYAQNVIIPDANFKAALLADGSINTVDDGEISMAEATAFAGLMDVSGQSISDLTGIEAFTNLLRLNVSNNSITSLDLSNNTGLDNVNALNNSITQANLTGLSQVTYLNLSNNALETVDVSTLTSLVSFFISNNNLVSLDVSNNTNITLLSAPLNDLEAIDVSDLAGLKTLFVQHNELTSIDLSSNPVLESIDIATNMLSEIDFSNNPEMVQVLVGDNWISSLDLSDLQNVIQVDVRNSDSLSSLNVANGNNTNFNLFRATGSPLLTCVAVDDSAYSATNWTDIDAGLSFSLDCRCLVEIPDANFKAALVADTNINTDMDDEISCEEAATFSGEIDVSGLSISDMTGIEAFTEITSLDCRNNLLTSLDVSQNVVLENLFCHINSLTSLDVTQNLMLKQLGLNGNQLSMLDVHNNSALSVLSVNFNPLESLDLSQNTALTVLDCNGGDLTSLDLSNNSSLTLVFCHNNNLSALVMANGNNSNVPGGSFNASGNPNLTCIEVDDVSYSETNWTDVDPGVSFSLNCITFVDELKSGVLDVYPNPSIYSLNVSSPNQEFYELTNLQGVPLMSGTLQTGNNSIDISAMESGVYLLKSGRTAVRVTKL